MRIGMIGLGKLGLPVAVSIAGRGHHVMGYDINPERMTKDPQPYMEAGPWGKGNFNDFLAKADSLYFGSLEEVADHSEIIFVAVQTPHEPEYEGITPLPAKRKDFDYSFLKKAISDLSKVVKPETLVVVISTCLPGTMRREILPLLPDKVHFAYNPFFIAMGTVMMDFLHPEFVLVGTDDEKTASFLESFYDSIHKRKVRCMSIESAELTKVAYNTFISFKIAYANTLMEICSALPLADVDEVTEALKNATDRLISPKYLSGGMGDGGACHPRDNIAMSWLARQLGLSYDLFEAVMDCRQEQAARLAEIVRYEAEQTDLPIVIYGYAFKADTNIAVGSPALLVATFLESLEPILYDPVIDKEFEKPFFPAVYLLGCNHSGLEKENWMEGSIVIDPFRVTKEQEGVRFLRLGEGDFTW